METLSKTIQETINITLLRRGDSREFAAFVRIYQDMVFACCRTVGLHEDQIEDAASDTFLAAFGSIKNYSGKSRLSSWLWKIAYHKALDYCKKKQNNGIASDITIENLASADPLPGHELSQEEQSTAVWEAVKRLPEPQSAAIVLFYREGKSIQDIAGILEISENTVKTFLFRGRKELFNHLQSIWETNYVRQ